MRDPQLVIELRQALDSPAPAGRQKEQVIQDLLEAHPELIPTPGRLHHPLQFKSVVSKFPLGTELITDYVWISKSSDTWQVTLVELESPDKLLYTKSTKKPAKSAEFNAAIDQVRSWKQFLALNEQEVNRRLLPLLQPPNMRVNPIKYKFQLIIGRSNNKNLTDNRKRDFRALQEELDIDIFTYDQLIDYYENDLFIEKNVLRLAGTSYEFKNLKTEPLNMFAYMRPGEIALSSDDTNKLEAWGFEIKAWARGTPLTLNGKSPAGDLAKSAFQSFGRS